MIVVGLVEQVSNKGNRDLSDTTGRCVCFLPGSKLLQQLEVGFACVDQVLGVSGAHAGERLTHQTQDPLHLFRLNLLAAGCKSSISVSLCKDGEERHWVIAVPEEWVNVVFEAKRSPDGPMFVFLFGVLFTNSIADGFLHKAKISFEVHLESRGQSLQEFVCGK